MLTKTKTDAVSQPPEEDFVSILGRQIMFHCSKTMLIHRIHRLAYGGFHTTLMITQGAVQGVFAVLKSQKVEENKSRFTELIMTVASVARRQRLWRDVLWMIGPTAQDLGVILTLEDRDRLELATREFQHSGDFRRHSSIYPNYAVCKPSL